MVTRAEERQIGTTRFGCGCTVHVELDVNGITPWLEHCPRHAAAPALLKALEGMLASHGETWEVVDKLNQRTSECRCPECKNARAAIHAAKGGGLKVEPGAGARFARDAYRPKRRAVKGDQP